MNCILIVLGGYLIGSFAAAILVSRWWSGRDIRMLGDSNAGTANVARHLGLKPAAVVAVVDITKGALPVYLARLFNLPEACAVLAAVAAVVGHRFPLYFRFRGGRGLATSLGALLMLTPRQTLLILPVYGMMYFVSRGSGIMATLMAFPLLILLNYWEGYDPWLVWSPLIMAFTTSALSLPEIRARWQQIRDARRLLYELLHPHNGHRPPVQTAILTDSIASLPATLCQQEGIHVLPVALILPQGVLRDNLDIEPRVYYQALRRDGLQPKTSAPSPGEYLQRIRELGDNGRSVLILTPPAELTQCFNSAQLAAQLAAEEDLEALVVDTRLAGPAQGLLALAAARLAASGASARQIVETLPALIPQIGIIGVLDTLQFLERSGRVAAISPLLRSTLQVYPIMTLRQGQIRLEGVERTRQKAIEHMVAWLQKHLQPGTCILMCFHADAPEEGQALCQRLIELLKPREHYLTEMTPVVGAHAGPGVLGVAWWQQGSPPF